MITASEALRLPSAQLTPAEKEAADAMEREIDAFIRQHMTRNGVRFQTKETRMPVVTEVQWRLRRAGWQLQTMALEEQHPLFHKRMTLVGYGFVITPSDEAQAASSMFASA